MISDKLREQKEGVRSINEDGSVDIYFGPTLPEAGESNWIQTTPDRLWFTYFRLFIPTEPFFDRSWELPDIENID